MVPLAAQRLYIAAGATAAGEKARRYVPGVLPRDWVLAPEPDDVAVILAVDGELDPSILDRARPALRVIATLGPQVDGSADLTGVHTVTLPDESSFSRQTVAEFAVMLMMMLTRNVLSAVRTTNAAAWAPGRDTPVLTDQQTYTYNWPAVTGSGFLIGRTVGIVGAGTIGAALAHRLAPFGVRLLYTQRHRLAPGDEKSIGIEWRTFDDLLRESDLLALCHRLQLGPGGNEHQFGRREFALMKRTAFVVNVARGRVIDENALVEALDDGAIAGVGLDVFRDEPLPKDHPLLARAGDKVILTPHIAAGSENEYWRSVVLAAVEATAR
jgi:glyoxylate reductase